jgi:hypothetical protein
MAEPPKKQARREDPSADSASAAPVRRLLRDHWHHVALWLPRHDVAELSCASTELRALLHEDAFGAAWARTHRVAHGSVHLVGPTLLALTTVLPAFRVGGGNELDAVAVLIPPVPAEPLPNWSTSTATAEVTYWAGVLWGRLTVQYTPQSARTSGVLHGRNKPHGDWVIAKWKGSEPCVHVQQTFVRGAATGPCAFYRGVPGTRQPFAVGAAHDGRRCGPWVFYRRDAARQARCLHNYDGGARTRYHYKDGVLAAEGSWPAVGALIEELKSSRLAQRVGANADVVAPATWRLFRPSGTLALACALHYWVAPPPTGKDSEKRNFLNGMHGTACAYHADGRTLSCTAFISALDTNASSATRSTAIRPWLFFNARGALECQTTGCWDTEDDGKTWSAREYGLRLVFSGGTVSSGWILTKEATPWSQRLERETTAVVRDLATACAY